MSSGLVGSALSTKELGGENRSMRLLAYGVIKEHLE